MSHRFKPPRLHGVPFHPAVVHFPIAAWTGASCLSIANVVFPGHEFSTYSYYCNIIGILTALVAIIFGMLEAAGVPDNDELKGSVVYHAGAAAGSWFFYTGMLILQLSGFEILALLSGLIGFVFLVIAGHLGALLVYEHGYPVLPDH